MGREVTVVMRHALGAPVVVALLLAGGCRNIDVVTESYATLAEARATGAVGAGRIPEGLPPGTHDLREARDLDTARRWTLFSFPPAEREALMALLEPQEMSLEGENCDVPGRIEWWPVLLRNRLNAAQISATGLRTYKGRNSDLVYAVNWSQGRAYAWTLDRR
jgi:hypothetical protein